MMETAFVSILGLGLLLGIKHAVEPDHVIAVSTIASRTRQLWRSSLAGVFWGIGHTLTLLVVGVALLLLKGEIPEVWAMSLEFLVGIMLVYLGASSLITWRRKGLRVQEHAHGEEMHKHVVAAAEGAEHQHEGGHVGYYLKSMLVGFVHGLAGSAAMFVLTMQTVEGLWQAAAYIGVFGIGTVIGMLACTTVIGLPFLLAKGNSALQKGLTRLTGAVSTAFGVYYMYNLGVTEGLFKLWWS